MNLYENIKKNLKESEKLTFDDCEVYIPEEFKPIRCWYGERNVEVYRYRYKKDKDIYLQYYSTDEFSIGSEDNFNKCYKIMNDTKSSKIKREGNIIYNTWDNYMFHLKKYLKYDDYQIIDMCDNLSDLLHEFLDKYGKDLKESEDEIKNFYYDSLLGERRQVPSRKQYEEEISKLPNLEDYADVSYEGFIHSLADSGVITDEEAEKYLSDKDK